MFGHIPAFLITTSQQETRLPAGGTLKSAFGETQALKVFPW